MADSFLQRLFATSKKPSTATYGADGPQIYTDLMVGGEDTNRLLDGRSKWPIYNEMRKSDAAVKSTISMFMLSILGADWSFNPATDDPEGRMIADACSWQFGLSGPGEGPMDKGWQEGARQSFLFLPFGCMFEEEIWGDVTHWVDEAGTDHIIRPLLRLAPRFPSTIAEAKVDPKTGAIISLVQDLPNTQPIPGDKITSYILDREGNDIFGTALIRPMYGPWRMKKALMVAAAIGWDRYAAGVPVVRYPEGGGPDALKKAEQIGRNYRVHERAWIVLEGAAPTGNNPGSGWDIDILNGAQSLADPIPLLRHYDQQIAMAAQQQFSSLGTTETGSRAVGETLRDPFLLAQESYAALFIEARMRGPVRKFVNINFGEEKKAPTLTVSGLAQKDLTSIVSAMVQLAGIGYSFTEPDLQDDMRVLMDLRKLPDEKRKQIEEAMTQAQDQGFGVAPVQEGTAPPVAA